VLVFNSYDIYNEVNYVEQKVKEREIIIQEGLEAKKDTIFIPGYHTRTKYAMHDAPYSSPLLSRYYGTEIIFTW
jgi:hypothetical protein